MNHFSGTLPKQATNIYKNIPQQEIWNYIADFEIEYIVYNFIRCISDIETFKSYFSVI
jgi:hypothetical protein